ncbi:MAG: N-acetylglucosamine-6-phosphate deacetylase, partial [Raoultibacter sp.]
AIARYEAARGVTALCPATMTYPEATLDAIVSAAAVHVDAPDAAALVGINMEGPFISSDKIGAQNPAYVQVPDTALFRRLQASARGLIKLVDVAPEVEGAFDFIDEFHDEVRISVAHTCADYEIATQAFQRGARQVTHLYNAMPSLHHRQPGVIGAAFDADDVMVEVIADGVHIHPAMVRVAFSL